MSKFAVIWTHVFNSIDKVNRTLFWAGIVLVIGMTIIANYEVFMRYALNNPSTWAGESLQMLLIVLAMLLCGWVLLEEGHVMVDIVPRKLNPRRRSWLYCLTSIVGAIYAGVIAWLSWLVFGGSLAMGELSSITGAPIYPVKLMFFIGFSILVLSFLARAYRYYRLAMTESKAEGKIG